MIQITQKQLDVLKMREVDGMTFTAIAKHYGRTQSRAVQWYNQAVRSRRANEEHGPGDNLLGLRVRASNVLANANIYKRSEVAAGVASGTISPGFRPHYGEACHAEVLAWLENSKHQTK